MPSAAGQAVTARRQTRTARGRTPGPPTLVKNPNVLLYRGSFWLFLAFAAAVLLAFWPTYFSRFAQQPTFHAHAHGLTMALWCGMLIAQAWLIRTGRRGLHRQLGAASYVLVPLMVLATLNFLHFRLQGAQQLGNVGAYIFALIVNALVAFVVLYGLAIYYRRQAAVHARYMICTIFPLFTPVTDRLIGAHVPSLVPLVPRIDGAPILPFAGFLLADAMLVALSIWDWRANGRVNVFPVALGVLLLYHASVLTLHRVPTWHAFGAWFAGLSLS